MAIARRATATASSSASVTSLAPTWDVTPSNGDLLLTIFVAIVQTSLTAPSGWTLLGTRDSGSALRSWAYQRTASSEPASNTWTLGASTKCAVWSGAYSGADVATVTALSTTGLVTPSITVPANGWLVTAGGGRHSNTGSPSSWTTSDGQDLERLDFGSNVAASHDVAAAVYDSNRALSAGSHSRTLTSTNTETASLAWALAFGPSAAPASGGARWGVHL